MKYTYRNYNLGRAIDSKSMEFEKELYLLIDKYTEVYIETESFAEKNEVKS